MEWHEVGSLPEFGKFIKAHRRELNLTQVEFSKRIKVSHATLSALENGKCVSSTTMHKALHEVGYRAVLVPEDAELPTDDA